MTLYEIKAELEQAIAEMLNNVDEETGEVSPESVERFNELNEAREEKLDNIGAYIKNLRAEIKMLKEEEQNLKARREAKEKKEENLIKYVESVLDGEKFESPRVAFSYRKSEQVVIADEDLIPEEYTVTKTETKADKTKIKAALKAGEEVNGAFLQAKNNLQVK